MATIITRELGSTAKNSPLTFNEFDNNINNLHYELRDKFDSKILKSYDNLVNLYKFSVPVISLFIYDTTKDSDGGAWTERIAPNNNLVTGKWLGTFANTEEARSDNGIDGDYFFNSTDNKLYKLVAGSQTEIFFGNNSEFPKLAGIINLGSKVILIDLLGDNYPVWGVYNSSNCTNAKMINGRLVLGESGVKIIDVIKQSVTNLGISGTINDIDVCELANANCCVVSELKLPTIGIATTNGLKIYTNNEIIVNSVDTNSFTNVNINYEMITGSKNTNLIYYATAPNTLSDNFSLSTITCSGNSSKLLAGSRSKLFRTSGNKANIINNNEENNIANITADISHNYNTGYSVNPKRCYIADTITGNITGNITDRINGSTAAILGTLISNKVNTGTDLVQYSGFSNTNYIRENYSSELDFGTNEFNISSWVKFNELGALGQSALNWNGMTTLGTDVYATNYGGGIYKQTNGTGNFISLGQANRQWSGMTTLGTDVYGCVYNGDIYKQTNGTGDFIALGQTTRQWYGMTTLGSDVYACVFGGDIYKQTNGTGDFIALGQTSRNWAGLTTLGSDVYGCVYNGDIYKQTNGTGDFVALGQTSRSWFGMTTLGTDVYASVRGGDIYKQTNGTGNFIALGQTIRSWRALVSFNGYLYAGNYGGDIYKFTPEMLTPKTIVERSYPTGPKISLTTSNGGYITATLYDGTTTKTVTTINNCPSGIPQKVSASYTKDGTLSISVNGKISNKTFGLPLLSLNNSDAVLTIGNSYDLTTPFLGSLSLLKLSATVPSKEQELFMYEQEKQLFNENVKCVLPENATISDISYDKTLDNYSVTTPNYLTTFNNLKVIDIKNTPTYSKIAINKYKIASKLDNTLDIITPLKYNYREEYYDSNISNSTKLDTFDYIGGFTGNISNGSYTILSVANITYPIEYIGAIISGTGIPENTYILNVSGTTIYISNAATATTTGLAISFRDFYLPIGYKARIVNLAGLVKQKGTTKDYITIYDGFRKKVRFHSSLVGAALNNTAQVSIQACQYNNI